MSDPATSAWLDGNEAAARVAIRSLWSPKIDNAEVARLRAATWITAAVSSPAIL